MGAYSCRYCMSVPDKGILCGAYSESTRPDKKFWAHFPLCKTENCPLDNPGLLHTPMGDATLEQ